MPDPNTNARATVELLKDAALAANDPFEALDGRQAIVVPAGCHVHEFRPAVTPLEHIRQKVKFDDAFSLAAYINRFKRPATQIFADSVNYRICAIFDYHIPPEGDVLDAEQHCDHQAHFTPVQSEQWKRWTGIEGKALAQRRFAEFIEENYEDVREPAAADLLEMVTRLQARRKVTFESGIRLSDGTSKLTYNEETETGGKGDMVIPSEIQLGIPVFYGGEAYKVRCLLRYRIEEGVLSFQVILNRRKMIEDSAFETFVKAVGDATSIAPYYGAPVD